MSTALDLRPANQPAGERHPPANIEAEQALLGAILYDNDAYHRVDGLLASHFYEPFHGRLWQEVSNRIEKGLAAGPVLLTEHFNRDTAFEELGGIRYLADLVDRAPPSVSAPSYSAEIIDIAFRREVMRIGAEAIVQAEEDRDHTGREIVGEVEQQLYALGETTVRQGFRAFGDYLTEAVQTAAEAFQRDGNLSGISTGLIDLDRKLGGMHPSDLLILAARPSMGKAQPLDALVLGADGRWLTMGDVRLGQALASIDGGPSVVTGVFPQGRKVIHRVRFSDGRTAEACGEHLWRVHYRAWSAPRILSTDAVAELLTKKRYHGRLWLDTHAGEFGADENLPLDPWVLGALIGDGKLSDRTPRFFTKDPEVVCGMQARLDASMEVVSEGDDLTYRIRTAAGRTRKGLQGTVPNSVTNALEELDLHGCRSETKFIPPAYLAACRQSRLALLRGLLDTDGWVEGFGAVRFATNSPRLAIDVVALVRSLGGRAGVGTKRPNFTHKGERRTGLLSYVVNIQGLAGDELFSIARKAARVRLPTRNRRVTFADIEPTRTAEAQCIAVSHPSHLYLTDDYVVTHNTALACNVAFDAAKHYAFEVQPDGEKKTVAGGVVAFFSLEMSGEQLAMRILAEASGVSGDKIRKGEIDANEFGRIRDAAELINTLPLHIDDTAGLSIGKLAARARRLKRTVGLDLIVVDYLQLLRGNRIYKGGERVQEVSEITVGLKGLAKDLGVPVLALSQLSRQVENREDKRPQLSDLRESGSIEQDADMVMFIYREEYYVGRNEPAADTPEHQRWQDEMYACRGKAEAIIAKQRHGPIGTVHLAFNADTTKFGNLARHEPYGSERLPYGEDA